MRGMGRHQAGLIAASCTLPYLGWSLAEGRTGELFWVLPALVAPGFDARVDARWRLMAQAAWWSVLAAAPLVARSQHRGVAGLALVAALGAAIALWLSRHGVAEARRRSRRAPRDFGRTLATSAVVTAGLGMWCTSAFAMEMLTHPSLSDLVFFGVGSVFLCAAWLIASGRTAGLALAIAPPVIAWVHLTIVAAFRDFPVIIDVRPLLLVPLAVVALPMTPLLLILLPREKRPRVSRTVVRAAKWLAVAGCLSATVYT